MLAILFADNSFSEKQLGSENVKSESAEAGKGGVYVAVGVHGGVSHSSSDASSEVHSVHRPFNSTIWGGTVAFGVKHASGKNFVGVEFGADLGSQDKLARVGGLQERVNYRGAVSSTKRDIVRQMLRSSSETFALSPQDHPTGAGIDTDVVHRDVWNGYVNVLRYLGGSNADLPNNEFVLAREASGRKILEIQEGEGEVMHNEVNLRDFLGNSAQQIENLGNGNLVDGLSAVKNTICDDYGALARAFSHVAENPLNFINIPVANSGLDGSHLKRNGAYIMECFLGNRKSEKLVIAPRNLYHTLGIDEANMGDVEPQAVLDDLDAIYFPTINEQADVVVNNRQILVDRLERKTQFRACPYFSLVAGRYFEKLDSSLYAKIGCMQLHGHLIPVNDIGLNESSFNKMTPFFAIGASRDVNDRVGIAVEFAHAFETKKSVRDRVANESIDRNVKIRRDTVKLMVVVNL